MIDKQPKARGRGMKVTFSVPVDWIDRPVAVVGDFNDWDPSANPLRKKGPVRTASVALDAGRSYEFRYVDDIGRWHDDPAADDLVRNSFGGVNGVIDLTEPSTDS